MVNSYFMGIKKIMGDKKMAKLDEFTHDEILDMVSNGEISISQYYDYKRKLLNDRKYLRKRKYVLKSQINNICKKPRDRKISFGKFWTAVNIGLVGGAIAGAALTDSDASTLNMIINGVAGGLIGEGAVGTGTFLYATKLISNKVNDYRLKNKKLEIFEIGNADKEVMQRLKEIQDEEEKRGMQDLTIEP